MHVSTQALLYRHSSTGKRRATHSKRPDAVKPSPKYAETTRQADVGVSGAGPEARQVDLVRLQRHGSTGTLQARLYRTQLYRHGSTGKALQARLFKHGCVRLHV